MAETTIAKRTTAQIGLPTPGTPPADDFNHIPSPDRSHRQPVGLSTPFSPSFESFNASDACSTQRDHVLYPDYGNKFSLNDKPLFDSASQHSPSPSPRVSHRNVATAPGEIKPKTSRQDSATFLRTVPEHVVGVVQIYNHDPLGYTRYINDQNDRHRAMRRERATYEAQIAAAKKALPLPMVSVAASRDPHTLQQLDLLNRAPPRIKKGKPYSCPSMTGPIIGMPPGSPDGPPLIQVSEQSMSPEVEANTVSYKRSRETVIEEVGPQSTPAKRRRSQVVRASASANVVTDMQLQSAKRRRRQSSVGPSSPGPQGSPGQHNKSKTHTRAQASKKVDDDLKDSEWMKLPDYCPNTASLDRPNSKKLRVSWGTSDPLDLSNDPDERYLHPQEVELAATLRFHCNQYLINKRRIFKAKVKCMQEGKAFNKTACQQCTAMDVNKASKLWAAFDEVGWFDEHWFRQYV